MGRNGLILPDVTTLVTYHKKASGLRREQQESVAAGAGVAALTEGRSTWQKLS